MIPASIDRVAVTGYLHPRYAASLAEFGKPRALPRCGGWILERAIGDTGCVDAMGPYPLFACAEWGALANDLEALDEDLVTLSLVADPFGSFDRELLEEAFDVVAPFKTHYVAELSQPLREVVGRRHRKAAEKALRHVDVERVAEPIEFLDEWSELYAAFAARRCFAGIKAFSREAFSHQLRLPGLFMFRASRRGETVGFDLWLVHGDVAYAHLVALSEDAYALGAGYALKWWIANYFYGRVSRLDLGGGVGLSDSVVDGLTAFKRGWTNTTRTAHFCGRIYDRRRYEELVRLAGAARSNYFPGYRAGEFDSGP